MHLRPFQQVDVFTATPYRGNPVAVVLDGADLSDAQLQDFARWTNLSETTFMLAPTDAQADYRLRIFTPGGELQFAGHPTLGSCHAWLQHGGKPKASAEVIQQCGVGLVRIRRESTRLSFAAPALQRGAPASSLLASVTRALGLTPSQVQSAQLLDNGTQWLGLLLDSAQTVQQLAPDFSALKRSGHKVGVAGLQVAAALDGANVSRAADSPALEVRAFAPHLGVDEDPVTGSLNASLAQWLIADGHLGATYVAAQGASLGRAGRVHIQRDAAGQVWVGGQAFTCISGNVHL